MSQPRPPKVDCLVLAQDKVIRAMLATCAESVGLAVHQFGSARLAVEAIQRRGQCYSFAMVAPKVDDADASKLASALASSGACERVVGYGIHPHKGAATFEHRGFPVDFVELFLELTGRAKAIAAPASAEPHLTDRAA